MKRKITRKRNLRIINTSRVLTVKSTNFNSVLIMVKSLKKKR